MDRTEKSLKINDQMIATENNFHPNSFIGSETGRSPVSAKYQLNDKKIRIDESYMPTQLRGKLWIYNGAIGEG